MNRPLHWDPETLWQTLEPLAPGLSVEILPETGSTSTELLERSRRGLTEPCLLLAEALDPAGEHLGLKWPNDLWLRGQDRKLGGLLIEVAPLADALSAQERWLVIGIGLNIAPLPAGTADPALFRTGHAGLQEIDPTLDAPAALHRVAAPLLRAVLDFGVQGGAAALARFATRDVLAGRRVQVGELAGIASGIAHDGALLLRDEAGRLQVVHSGEASVRPC